MSDENTAGAPEESSGSLADAIAAHLELKREHGADPEVVEHELEDALSPPRRDQPAAQEPAAPEPAASEPEPDPPAEPAAEPEPEPASEPADEPEPLAAPETVAADGAPKPGEITGTIEFEFGDDPDAGYPIGSGDPAEPIPEHDLLEETPDFFEETPEHDKLWFDEAPPRKFDF